MHAYKIYMPEVYGGIPQVISMMSRVSNAASSVLTARYAGFGRKYSFEGLPVTATSSIATLFSMPIAPFYPFLFWWKSARSDVVVHHAPFPLTDLAIWIGFPRKKKLIVFWHAEVLGKRRLMKLFDPFIKRALERADAIIVSDAANITKSPYVAQHVAKCDVAPFGCDISYWSSLTDAEQSVVAALKAKHPRLVVTTGRLVGYKGHDVLIRAIQDIDGHAVIIGDGPKRAELEALIAALGVQNKVTLAGSLPRDELKIYLHAADVFTLPSVTEAEAFGIAQIEAMAAGCPIVNTQLNSAVPLIARHEIEGLTVAPNNSADLARAISFLLDNRDTARRFGTTASARAESEYDQNAFIGKISAILER